MKINSPNAWKVLLSAFFALLLISARATLISNGGFETGTASPWVVGGGQQLISSYGSFAHSGTYYLWLGGTVNESDYAFQTITIPANATAANLSFYYNIYTLETGSTAKDTFTAVIRNPNTGALLATIGNWSNLNHTPAGNPYYSLQTFDLLSYAGQSIEIYFSSLNSATLPTDFRVDDVSVQVTTPTIPTVQTLLASSVGTTSATLNGQVTSDGGSPVLERRIEWATSAGNWGTGTSGVDYGFFSDATSTFNISGANFSLSLTGFASNTSYKYRVWARNSVGWSDVNSVNVVPFTTGTTTFYAITTASSPTAGGSTSGGGNYSSGQSVTVAANAYSGYGFASWSEGGNVVSSSASYSFTASANHNLTANFSYVGLVPVAGFSGDLQPVTGKLSNYNGGYSTGSGLSYAWTLSDGRSSTAIAPSFSFNSPGVYTISLTVTDSIGRYSTASAVIYVQAANNGSTPGQPVGADPVVLSAGNYVQQHVDLRLPGKGFPLEFTRSYNSKFGDQTGLPLGFGWTHAYNEHINNTGTNALVIRGDGSTWTFFPTNSGYIAEPGVFDSLVTNVDGTWSLIDKNQTVKRFNSTGHLISIIDKNGNVLNLSYVGGVLRQIQDTAGRAILLNTNTFGCISDITDPIGRTTFFQYDSNTNLIRVIDTMTRTNSFSYDINHQLTDAFDPKGNCFVHNEYDTNSFVVLRQHDVLNNWTYFAYDFINRITYETNALGEVSVQTFDTNLLATNIVDEAGHQQSFVYDASRNRIMVKDKNGNSSSYGYDAHGNVTNNIDALNNATSIEYNSTNNPTKRSDALNHFTTFSYNGSGNLSQTTNALGLVSLVDYNASGLPQVLTDANGHKTTNTFDLQGNLTKVQDALGNTTTFGYDGAGRKVAQTNANNKVTRYFYDNDDNLLRVVDPLNHTNSFIYDVNNNRISTIDARGAATTNTFDFKDRLVSTRNALGGVTSYEYDALNHKTKVTNARNGVTTFGYDVVGNLVASTNALNQVTRYTYDANGNQTSIINPLGQITTNIFDTLNRLVMTVDPQGHTNQAVYDAIGRRVQTIDALNHTNQFAYDSIGRLTQATNANGGTTKFSYDGVGNRLVTTDPNNHSTTNIFNLLNRLVQNRDASGGLYQFAYDGVGNRTNQIDPKGQTIRYAYDANNRRTSITYPTGSPVTFSYDVNDNRTNMTDSLGTTTYQYDVLNRLVSVADSFGKTVLYGYDANGNRVSITYPGGKIVTYGYDLLDRMISVTNWLNGVTTYTYDLAGNLVHTTNPNASRVDYGYDTASHLISMTNTGPNSAIICSYAYTLDAVGNHTQVSQKEQLQTLPIVGSFNYTYDNDNKMVTSEAQVQGFDADGNMISLNPTNLLSYDFENRLTQTVFAGVTNTYQYDGVGDRMSADRAGLVTHYVLGLNNPLTQVLAETDSSGDVTTYYVYGLGLISRIDSSGNANYYHFDSRGSTIALTDASGQIKEAYAYDPFGRPIDGQLSDNRFRYLGRHGVMDEEDGFLYIRARYYSTRRGRFITKDPTTGNDGDSQSLNRYIYALNNPVRLIDISGLSAREAGHITIVYATSDNSRFHNVLISPQTDGLDTRMAGSTPQLQAAGFSFGDPAIRDRMLALGNLTKDAVTSDRAEEALQFSWSQRGRLNFLGRVSTVIDIGVDVSEQIRSVNDVNSFASASQAVAINYLMDFIHISDVSTLLYGNSGHVTGSQVIQTEHTAAIAIASEELALPSQIMNNYMNGINAAGNLLYQETGF